MFPMSGYSPDGQGTLSISSLESDTGLRTDEDNSSFSWGDEEHTTSHVAEQGRKDSLTSLLVYSTLKHSSAGRTKSSEAENSATSTDNDSETVFPSPARA